LVVKFQVGAWKLLVSRVYILLKLLLMSNLDVFFYQKHGQS